ncbi:hypothetical protein I5L01_05245 [Erythrobacter sp. YJ-T3-07]|uniref:hypothetical protein n=1 Tax=Erythrobacter sp. YJ-T3-07 TaxID=2793063 RepID=UPI0018D43DA1|nr:hypothetical protein [Erythrobacter sp. YJ-T3-07]MBH1943637.1 hypothetical protein [Erythrobacter sp. YJ-T3-07]
MSDIDPTKPIPNDEKFKPQNQQGSGKAKPSARRDASRPADTGGDDLSRGSQPDTRRAGSGAR